MFFKHRTRVFKHWTHVFKHMTHVFNLNCTESAIEYLSNRDLVESERLQKLYRQFKDQIKRHKCINIYNFIVFFLQDTKYFRQLQRQVHCQDQDYQREVRFKLIFNFWSGQLSIVFILRTRKLLSF